MGRQRNRPQMKEQKKSPEKELNEMEAKNLSYIEFKLMVIWMLNSMGKDRNHKKGPSEMKNTISEMKNT